MFFIGLRKSLFTFLLGGELSCRPNEISFEKRIDVQIILEIDEKVTLKYHQPIIHVDHESLFFTPPPPLAPNHNLSMIKKQWSLNRIMNKKVKFKRFNFWLRDKIYMNEHTRLVIQKESRHMVYLCSFKLYSS